MIVPSSPTKGDDLSNRRHRSHASFQRREFNDRRFLYEVPHLVRVIVRMQQCCFRDCRNRSGRLFTHREGFHDPTLCQDVLDPADKRRGANLAPMKVKRSLDEDDESDQTYHQQDPYHRPTLCE